MKNVKVWAAASAAVVLLAGLTACSPSNSGSGDSSKVTIGIKFD